MSFLQRSYFVLGGLALAILVSACGGAKPAVDVAPSNDQTVVEKKPELTEEQAASKATDVKADAVKMEEENHKLRQEIYETKVKLGMEVDSGIPETQASATPAASASKAPEAAKAPAKSSKKKGK